VRPWFADRPVDKITPADVRRWQAHLDRNVGPATLAQCQSLAVRIFQFAMDEGAIDANPARKVPPPKRRVDPEEVFGGPGVPRGTRTVLSRHNLRRTYHHALPSWPTPLSPLRPTARRILLILRDGGPQRVDQLTV
jgi:hypothetical protein